jgi:VanZ family protein
MPACKKEYEHKFLPFSPVFTNLMNTFFARFWVLAVCNGENDNFVSSFNHFLRMAVLRFIKNYHLSLFVIFLILLLSTISGNAVEKVSVFHYEHMDKIVHLLMYLSLSSVIAIEIMKNNSEYGLIKALVIAVLISLIYGGLLELVQKYLTQTRSGDWFDRLFDFIGILLSIPLLLVYKKVSRN